MSKVCNPCYRLRMRSQISETPMRSISFEQNMRICFKFQETKKQSEASLLRHMRQMPLLKVFFENWRQPWSQPYNMLEKTMSIGMTYQFNLYFNFGTKNIEVTYGPHGDRRWDFGLLRGENDSIALTMRCSLFWLESLNFHSQGEIYSK